MPRRFATLDVFTDRPFAGNPLAVVRHADDLPTAKMQAIAAEFGLSETVFLLEPERAAHTAKMRIFTPSRELPFAGHPTIGTAIFLAEVFTGPASREEDCLITLEQEIGLVRVGVRLVPGEAPFAEFDAPKLPEDAGAAAPREAIARALGLGARDIGCGAHEPSRFTAGMPFTFVPVRGLAEIQRARVVADAWGEAFRGDGHGQCYVYTKETVAGGTYHARMFAPSAGIVEDPATGSAAAAFAGVVHRFERLKNGTHRGVIEQGYEMGRPSQIRVAAEVRAGALAGVRIGGHAVRVSEGQLLVERI